MVVRLALSVAILLIVGTLVPSPWRYEPARSADDARVIPRVAGVRLLDQLTGTDRHLEVVHDTSPPFWGGMPGNRDPLGELRALTARASAVVVAEVAGISSALSADQTWLESSLDLRVIDVPKPNGQPALVPGAMLRLSLDGGRLRFGAQDIVARRRWAALPEVGRRYVYFLVSTEDGMLLPFPETAIFELTTHGLRRLGHDGVDPSTEPMANVSERLALAIVARSASPRSAWMATRGSRDVAR